jgi:hypothetical protein
VSFITTYRLIADNAVEYEVVTANGEVRIINKWNDPDLFWSMRSRGGGTFAVLTKYWAQVYSSLPIHVFTSTFNANFSDPASDVTLRETLTAYVRNQVD